MVDSCRRRQSALRRRQHARDLRHTGLTFREIAEGTEATVGRRRRRRGVVFRESVLAKFVLALVAIFLVITIVWYAWAWIRFGKFLA